MLIAHLPSMDEGIRGRPTDWLLLFKVIIFNYSQAAFTEHAYLRA